MPKNTLLAMLLLILIMVIPASAAPQKSPSRPQTDTENIDGNTEKKQEQGATEQVLSDNWYTVTVNQNVHYGYYNEKFELANGRLRLLQHYWKQEEGYINEEQLGAFAENNSDIVPLFYNFHSTYRSTETVIDGNVKDGKMLTVKIRKGDQDLPIIKRSIPSKLIFSGFFPIWLARNTLKMKPNQTSNFSALLEDNLELNFAPVPGHIRLEKPDDFANKTHSKRLSVSYNMRSVWWIDNKGSYLRIEMPSQRILIERASKEAATRFLNAK